MENRQQQILSEIKSMMVSIRSQLEMLDTKMAELQQMVDPEEFAAESVDLDIELDEPVEEVPVIVDDDLPFDDVPDVPAAPEAPETSEVPEVEETAEVVEETLDEDIPESIFGEPETVTVAAKAKSVAKPTINDVMADNCAWRHDMPGAPVRDIRSAISLNDRVIFINLLFDEDAQTFVNTLSQINTMEALDQVVEYVTSNFPSWDMNSELVYRFMMAVRRKVK